MDFASARFDFRAKETILTPGASNLVALSLGGEDLDRSGFEDETPELGFEFDWAALGDQREGGR